MGSPLAPDSLSGGLRRVAWSVAVKRGNTAFVLEEETTYGRGGERQTLLNAPTTALAFWPLDRNRRSAARKNTAALRLA